MTDNVSKAIRSKIMQSIKGKDTKPELSVRKALHARGLRFRLHAEGLPGKPDLVFLKYRVALFVHGCFWHQHGCGKGKAQAWNRDYWLSKLEMNRERDAKNIKDIEDAGWKTIIVWECEIKGMNWGLLTERIKGEAK